MARLRSVFGGLWESDAVNMMQFTQIGPGRCLGNHFDRRRAAGWGVGLGGGAWRQLGEGVGWLSLAVAT